MIKAGNVVKLNPTKYPYAKDNYYIVNTVRIPLGLAPGKADIEQLAPALILPPTVLVPIEDLIETHCGWCDKHNAPMQRYKRDEHEWEAHRIAPGQWCSRNLHSWVAELNAIRTAAKERQLQRLAETKTRTP